MQPDKSELQKELADLKARVADLSARINTMPGGYWKPELTECYWYISSGGEVTQCTWDNDDTDCGCLAIGHLFRTEQEAQDRLFKLQIEQRLREMAGGFRPEIGEIREYLSLGPSGEPHGHFGPFTIQGTIPFRPGEAQKAIDAIGQADLKRYFEVAP